MGHRDPRARPVIELRSISAVLAGDARRQEGYLESEGAQESRKRTVKLITEPAAMAADDFANRGLVVNLDPPGQRDVQILERHNLHVATMQAAQRTESWLDGSGVSETAKVRGDVQVPWPHTNRLLL